MEQAAFRKLLMWQRAVGLTTALYRCTESFPKAEIYAMTSQMRRAAVSIPSNIAEGYGRNTRRDYARFLGIARGSTMELLTQIVVAQNLAFGDPQQLTALESRLNELGRMLSAAIKRLQADDPRLLPPKS